MDIQRPRSTTSTRSFKNHLRKRKFQNRGFDCGQTVVEQYKCRCGYHSLFTALMKKHIDEKHRQTRVSVKISEVFRDYSCRTCTFETYSILIYYKHFSKCASSSVETKCIERNENIQKDVKQFQCDICFYRTKGKELMSRHIIRKHTTDKNGKWFECDYCGYKTKTKEDLKTHALARHAAEKEGPALARPPAEKKAHATEKYVELYICNHCDYESRYKGHMNAHVARKHTAEKDVEWIRCDGCDYKTKLKCDMKTHVLRKHVADKDAKWFRCDKCSYKTKCNIIMKNHVLANHTPSKWWFKCSSCDYKSQNKTHVNRHLSTAHPLLRKDVKRFE